MNTAQQHHTRQARTTGRKRQNGGRAGAEAEAAASALAKADTTLSGGARIEALYCCQVARAANREPPRDLGTFAFLVF